MKAHLLTLVLAAFTGLVEADDSGTVKTPDGFSLQPAPNEPLRRVPGESIYHSGWNTPEPLKPIVQTSFTTVGVEAPALQNDQTDAGSETAALGAKPFIDLLNETPEKKPLVSTSTGETNEMLMRLAIWTVIILCLCILTLLGLRRWQRRQGLLPPGAGRSRVLETLSIGPGRAVSLVQLGSVRAVVGTDGSGIKTIVLAPPAFEEQLSDFDDEPPSVSATGEAA